MTKSTLFIFLFCAPIVCAQHQIHATFSPKEDFDTAILYKITPQNLIYTAHAKMDTEGQFHIPLDSTATAGMYRLVYAMPQEVYNFDLLYNGKEDIELKFNQDTGVEYIASEENKVLNAYYGAMAEIGQNIGKAYRQKPLDSVALLQLFDAQKTTQAQFEQQSKDLMVHEFIRANKRYVPKYIDAFDRYISKVKAHYFAAVDFKNPLLQSSDFFGEHAINYVFGFGGNSKQTVNDLRENIDSLQKTIKSNASKEIYYEIFKVLRLQMIEANYEQLALYISKHILMPTAVAMNDVEGIQAMRDFERTALGALTPNFNLEETVVGKNAKTLYDLKGSSSYILIFWSSSCSHCVDELPVIHQWLNQTSNKTINVVAVGLEDEAYTWNRLKYDMPNFTHVLALGKWEHPLVPQYNISSTPHYLVLDKDKVIVAKPQNLEELQPFIQK